MSAMEEAGRRLVKAFIDHEAIKLLPDAERLKFFDYGWDKGYIIINPFHRLATKEDSTE